MKRNAWSFSNGSVPTQSPETLFQAAVGCRKVRWSRAGTGKRGGVRVIYFVRTAAGEIWLLLVYPKSEQDNIPGHLLKAVREEIENG